MALETIQFKVLKTDRLGRQHHIPEKNIAQLSFSKF